MYGQSGVDPDRCFICRGAFTDEISQRQCSACNVFVHEPCLHWSGSVTSTHGLGGDEVYTVQCPNCGHAGRL